MTAEDIAKVLGGRRAGASWLARCPAHNDREPGLSIRQAEDDTVLVRWDAGCEQARVITALRSLAANAVRPPRRLDPPQQPKSQIRSRRLSAASLALQFGCSLDTLRRALLRNSDGSPATALGAALDIISGRAR